MRNAVEDVSRSLRALPGRFSQLLYLASLRDRAGDYQHWGLNREYGEARTRAAFSYLHRRTYDSFLQSDLPELLSVLRMCCEKSGRDPEALVSELFHEGAVKPSGTQEHSAMHFNYVLASLLALAQSKC
jgi:hypothetical protein